MRVIIEKPFGTTLEEAVELNRQVLSVFDEHQVFRIDHYLGKETVQNIMAFRFANGMFEPLWNRNYIDNIQITAAEDLGIGTRAGYYDTAGAMRDLIQNHMLQLLCHVAMEPPVELQRRRGARREGQGPPQRDGRGAGRRPEHGRPRSVHAGRRRRPRGARLHRGGGRPAGVAHRDLRRAAPGGRQLALGGRAVLPPYGQAPGAHGHRDRDHAAPGAAPRLRPGGIGGASGRTRSC